MSSMKIIQIKPSKKSLAILGLFKIPKSTVELAHSRMIKIKKANSLDEIAEINGAYLDLKNYLSSTK